MKIRLPLSHRSYYWGQRGDAWEIPPSASNVFTQEVLIKNANEHEHFGSELTQYCLLKAVSNASANVLIKMLLNVPPTDKEVLGLKPNRVSHLDTLSQFHLHV